MKNVIKYENLRIKRRKYYVEKFDAENRRVCCPNRKKREKSANIKGEIR